MANVSSNSTSNYHNRSVSLPAATKHPTTQTVEDELKKLKSLEDTSASSSISAGSICYGLTGLQELYQCLDDLLNLPSTNAALFGQKNKKSVDELLDISVRILDICGIAKDMVSKCKENARDLQSSLRRRKGSNCNIETSITKYLSSTRNLKKDAKRSLVELKQINQEINDSAPIIAEKLHDQSVIIRVLQDVNSRTITIFQSVLKFLSVKSHNQKKIKKWTLVARLVQKEQVGTESFFNELENTEAALCCLCKNHQIVQKRLQILEGSLEGLENQLGAMFRCLIRSRTTILNVLSC